MKVTAMRPVEESQLATSTDGERIAQDAYDVSIIIPVHNEEENAAPLCEELRQVMDADERSYEVILVDDGSKDRSVEMLRRATDGDPRFTIVQLRRNFGQTAALCAGFMHSRGAVIVPMDADLQNDPRDIPTLVAKLDEPPEYDIVSGWRKDRKDKMVTRRIPSQIANRLIRKVTGVKLHDYGCSLKAYRREVLEGVGFFSELHRFLPALAKWHGAKITEMVVNHRPRIHGTTKYGLKRTFKVVLDLITVKFLGHYMTKPLYFFGKLAAVSLVLAIGILGIAMLQKLGWVGEEPVKLHRNLLVTLSALLTSFSVQCILFGIVTELLVRVYHDHAERPPYQVRCVFRGGTASEETPKRKTVRASKA